MCVCQMSVWGLFVWTVSCFLFVVVPSRFSALCSSVFPLRPRCFYHHFITNTSFNLPYKPSQTEMMSLCAIKMLHTCVCVCAGRFGSAAFLLFFCAVYQNKPAACQTAARDRRNPGETHRFTHFTHQTSSRAQFDQVWSQNRTVVKPTHT